MRLDTSDIVAKRGPVWPRRHRPISEYQTGRGGSGPSFASLFELSREAEPFAFLAQAKEQGIQGALVTICAVDGSAPKPLGTQMAVLEDGRYVGYVSGGCVEAAIASEVVETIAARRDAILRFGRGSRFIDIRFPCGGGVELLIHVRPEAFLLRDALSCLQRRQAFTLAFDPASSHASIVTGPVQGGWSEGRYLRPYRPRTRLLLVGRGSEFEVMARVAEAGEFDLVLASPDTDSLQALSHLRARTHLLTAPDDPWDLPMDAWTATVLLFHEHEWEDTILARAATAEGFYVGALGSARSHATRRNRLAAMGLDQEQVNRIKGPIGLIGHARDPSVLALSVLSEVAMARIELDRG
ncbi:XdhC family protein [Devosia sp. ZW T5_3]|uniref:XdhC family protein n=1 Tax=Devosia sp. ZW T5_3 TaxID=3378085 RepID=UPI003854A797